MHTIITMKVITVNVNGIRSAASKGFFEWVKQQNADIVCLQEVRADLSQLTDKIFYPDNYIVNFVCGNKKGYSGVAIYSKNQPDNIITQLGWETADNEGRYLQADFGNLSIASVYLPSGTSGEQRQEIKYDFLDRYLLVLEQQIKQPRNYIICGDFNIAHKNIDLKNWRSNQKHSGFLPLERAWLDKLFDQVGFIDAYRYYNPSKIEYTWWSNFGKAWENNTGWRIDYHIISPLLADKIISTEIYRDKKFSDHAPLIINYDIN